MQYHIKSCVGGYGEGIVYTVASPRTRVDDEGGHTQQLYAMIVTPEYNKRMHSRLWQTHSQTDKHKIT